MLTKQMHTTDNHRHGDYPKRRAVAPAQAAVELLSMSMPAEAQFVTFARRAVQSVAEQLRMDADTTADLMLAVGEACNNGVLYGANKRDHAISITCRVIHTAARKDDLLEIEVRNHGGGFAGLVDNDDFVMPVPELMSDHGRGLPLMKSVVDSVDIRSEAGDTVVRLTKYLP